MKRFKKQKLNIDIEDSAGIKELKNECNQLIEKFNLLDNPFSEPGQEIIYEISLLMIKIKTLSESYY